MLIYRTKSSPPPSHTCKPLEPYIHPCESHLSPVQTHYGPKAVLYCILAAPIALASLGASGTNVFSSGKHEAIRTGGKNWRGWNLCWTRIWEWKEGGLDPTHKHPVAIGNKTVQNCTRSTNVVTFEILAYKRGCVNNNAHNGVYECFYLLGYSAVQPKRRFTYLLHVAMSQNALLKHWFHAVTPASNWSLLRSHNTSLLDGESCGAKIINSLREIFRYHDITEIIKEFRKVNQSSETE